MTIFSQSQRITLLAAFAVVSFSARLDAQVQRGLPEKTKGVKVDEKLGAYVSLNLKFEDEQGVTKELGDVIAGKKPVLLTLNYSGCPGLCVAQLDGLVRGVQGLGDLDLGKDFELISISIDPRETKEKAQGTKAKYTKGLSKHHNPDGWHFWIGQQASIDRIADELGFRYTYDKKNDRFNHVAMAAVISPTGKITRYLYDVGFEPSTLKFSLIEGSEGTVGTPFDSFVMWCMHYDPDENRYTASARKLLSVTAGVFVLVLFGSIAPFWFASSRKVKSTEQTSVETSSDTSSPEESDNQ